MTTNKRGTNVPPEDKQLEMLEYLAIHNLTAHPSALTIKQGKAIDTWELKTPMMVNGKLSGLHKLMYTMSILHDVDYQQTMAPYSERYCFEDEWRALSELIEWHKRGFDDQPPIGWVACRNMDAEVIVARVRRYYGEDYGQGMLGYLKKHSENGFQPFFPGVTPQQAADDLDISENDANHLFAFLRLAGEII